MFYSIYPLVIFLLVSVINHRTRQPRSITFEDKGWFTIIYNVQNETKLKNRDGYREINFKTEPILLTSTKQMDIIPVSESRYFYKSDKEQSGEKIFYNSDIQYKKTTKTHPYIFIMNLLNSIACIVFENKTNQFRVKVSL